MAVDAEVVVDSSSALAFLLRERGWRDVPAFLAIGIMSTVNYAEVVQRIRRYGASADVCFPALSAEGLVMVDADAATAHAAGELESLTRIKGVSLADRFCLALAMQRGLPVLTADRPWSELRLPVEVKLLR